MLGSAYSACRCSDYPSRVDNEAPRRINSCSGELFHDSDRLVFAHDRNQRRLCSGATHPVVRHLFRTAGLPQAARFNIVQGILHFDPGAATPVHTHPGIVVVTVLAGELTFKLNGSDTVYKEGQSFVEVAGQVVQARNASTAQTSAMVSYIIPKDAPLSTLHNATPAPAALPTTGGAADGALPIGLIGLAAGGLIAGGWLFRRRHGRV